MSASKSLVWNYFTPSEDGSTAKCKLCSKNIKRSGANTTNLMVHLERQHRQAHQELKEEDKRRKMQTHTLDEVSLQLSITSRTVVETAGLSVVSGTAGTIFTKFFHTREWGRNCGDLERPSNFYGCRVLCSNRLCEHRPTCRLQ